MKVIVTGGGGFLGRALIEELRARDAPLTSISRKSYPELEALGVRTIQADLAHPGAWQEAFAGVRDGTLQGTPEGDDGDMVRYEAGAFSLLLRAGG